MDEVVSMAGAAETELGLLSLDYIRTCDLNNGLL